ncbi:DUF2515 family protein [Fredinandcohnia sp. 179-A 10B2 NHS]|uniref:DUF2515 family protein n=1 Tax=Fredinandcohnia sp. 179-A 10B2 NHS TaxID=3235176 RepID=UPI0039A1D215
MCNFLQKHKVTPLPSSLKKVKKELISKKGPQKQLSSDESKLVHKIQETTQLLNLNNITRTNAYLDFYNRNPEIYWAFLAHMVSRNAGWNMTDLKGGQLPYLLSETEAEGFFSFIERGNWLIFQDAFPQLLLYEASKKQNKNLFPLLPFLNVSRFMEVMWNYYWSEKDPYTLVAAQICNEQQYIEDRVLTNPAYKKKVFETVEFKLQEILDLNHILFPYVHDGHVHLIGETVNHFESVQNRINLGKRLYSHIFNDDKKRNLIIEWANKTPHTASRKDYWPAIFHDLNEAVPGKLVKPRVRDCSLTLGSKRIYSPRLEHVWKNKIHEEAEQGDWYTDWRVVYNLINEKNVEDANIRDDYCSTLEKLELAIFAKLAISIFD